MTTNKHTPGPWDYFVGNANGRGLIRIEQSGTGVHIASLTRGAEQEANAALIARAPELLARVAELEKQREKTLDVIREVCNNPNEVLLGERNATLTAENTRLRELLRECREYVPVDLQDFIDGATNETPE